MPHTLTQDVNAENMEEYSKALAEDCMISDTYESATLYAKKESDNLYDISFIAYEPNKEQNQVMHSSTRILSKVDKDKLINIVTTIYKIFKTNPPFISPNIDNTKIVLIFNNKWKISLENLSKEEQLSIMETLEKIS